MTYWALGPIASFQSGSFGATDQKRNLCLPVLMRCPKDKALPYTAVVVLCAIVIGAILATLSSCFIGGGAMVGAARM